MHFFYLDESGDTGRDLLNPDQPIMVLGGISLRDEGWNATRIEFEKLIENFFRGEIPEGFELHAYDLLLPDGSGYFADFELEDRLSLAKDVIKLIETRKHNTHYIAFDKKNINNIECGLRLTFNPSSPFLLGFDYMITWIDWYVKEKLGRSFRIIRKTGKWQQQTNSRNRRKQYLTCIKQYRIKYNARLRK